MKHTDFLSLGAAIRVTVVVMELGIAHPAAHGGLGHASRTAWSHIGRWRHPRGPSWAGHVRWECCDLSSLAIVDLGHPADASTAQPGILVAVSPTIYCSLNQSSLPTQARIQLCQRPADCVTLGLVHQPVPSVLILAATRARVHAILRLELGTEGLDVHRFHIASDCVLHLNAISRILESNPLHSIVILSHDQWGSRGNWARCRIGVDTISCTRHIVLLYLRSIWLMLRRTQRSSWTILHLGHMGLHLGSWAASDRLLRVLSWVLLHLVLVLVMRHEQIWL